MSSSMNTSLNRLNAVTAVATSTILCLAAFIALMTYPTHKPSGNVLIKGIEVVKGRLEWHMDDRIQDFAKVTFDMDADFTPLFNWNTKQIFLSLVAEYGSSHHDVNQVVVWDRIVRSKGDAHIKLENAVNRYPFREISRNFANINESDFTLRWNAMPHVGILAYGEESRTGAVKIPARLAREGIARMYF